MTIYLNLEGREKYKLNVVLRVTGCEMQVEKVRNEKLKTRNTKLATRNTLF